MPASLSRIPLRRRASFSLPESLLVRLDQVAEATHQSRSRVLEALLIGEFSRLESNPDPDVLLWETRRFEPDLALDECPDLLARVAKLLGA